MRVFLYVFLFHFCSSTSLDSILSNSLLEAHKISSDTFGEMSFADSDQEHISANHPHFYCGPLGELKNTPEVLPTVYIDEAKDTGCLLSDLNTATSLQSDEIQKDSWTSVNFPSVLKLDVSALSYFNTEDSINRNDDEIVVQSSEERLSAEDPFGSNLDLNSPEHSKRLVVEFTPSALASYTTSILGHSVFSSTKAEDIIDSSPSWDEVLTGLAHKLNVETAMHGMDLDEISHNNTSTTTAASTDRRKRIRSRVLSMTCVWPKNVELSDLSRSVEVSNIQLLDPACVAQLMQRAAGSASVLRVTISTPQKTQNFEVRGLIQSGTIYSEPYSAAGLTGSGEIVGVADSGLNDLSCFLVDNSKAYSTITTDRSGTLQSSRRKVIQYISSADSLDYVGGHGTHVAATILGSSVETHTEMAGMAPGAKLVFLDAGLNNYIGSLTVPELYNDVFGLAYKSGARVHANSWKDGDKGYGTYSYDVDHFTSDNDDFLALFAAGNTGGYGANSVTAPSNSKNAVSVGASEVRDTKTDALASQSTVAWFSGMGPTSDGRIKPDIVAPGSFVMSAYAGSPSVLSSAISSKASSADVTCAAITGVGTSMSCPVAAGAALLIRQYFTDSSFWASVCNPSYSQCKAGAFKPSGYLVKAVLLHSGTPIRRYSTSDFDYKSSVDSKTLDSPPDSIQGYGGIKLTNVLPLRSGEGLSPSLELIVFDALVISDYTTFSWTITMPSSSSAQPLKITLCWYDVPSVLGSTSRLLIHNLDLKVVGPDNTVYWGNRVSGGGDKFNTNEQVYISSASCSGGSCVYKVSVSTYVLAQSDAQKFALVVTTNGAMSSYTTVKSSSSSSTNVAMSSESAQLLARTEELRGAGEGSQGGGGGQEEAGAAGANGGNGNSENNNKNGNGNYDSNNNKNSNGNSNNNSKSSSGSSQTKTDGSSSSSGSTTVSTGSTTTFNSGNSATVSIPATTLGISDKVVADTVTLSSVSLSYPGALQSLEVSLLVQDTLGVSSTGMIDGFYPFIFTLLVTAPNGHTAQVGGYSVYPVTDSFYQREWPRSWCQYNDPSTVFVATRDLSSAGLQGQGVWTVSATLAYSKAVSTMTYSGVVSLTFSGASSSSITTSGMKSAMVVPRAVSSTLTDSATLTFTAVSVCSAVLLAAAVSYYSFVTYYRRRVTQEWTTDGVSGHGLLSCT